MEEQIKERLVVLYHSYIYTHHTILICTMDEVLSFSGPMEMHKASWDEVCNLM